MTDSTTARRLPCGAWPSPITAADVAGQYRRVSFPVTIDGEVWWQETLPAELGRTTIVHLGAAGKPRQVLSAPWNVRTRVHEYGGRSYLPVRAARPGGGQSFAIVFANFADQRLYVTDEPGTDGAGATPRPLTPAPTAEPDTPEFRFADFVLSPDGGEVWCVQERHEAGEVTRAIVAVPLDGSAAEDAAAIRELVSGADFYAFPTPSPDGRRLAWVCWNHPRMPWDGTELRVARLDDGVVVGPGKGGLVKGGTTESVLAPVWHDDTRVYLISDWPGWWNLYTLNLAGAPAEAVYPAEEEFAAPLWQLGQRPYAVLADGQLAVLHGRDELRLGVLDPWTGELSDVDIPYQIFAPGLSADGMSVVLVAGGPSTPMSVIRVDITTGKAKKLSSPARRLPASGYLPKARKLEFEGKFGQEVHAWVYPPANPEAAAGEGELPPYVVWAHGGPASQVDRRLDLEKAYFTSRGIGVIDVNYGGSAGYGRVYRERLRHQWGVVDVQDVIAAAQALVSSGAADGARLAIRGGSAGGWTALATVTSHAADSPFMAATSYYGITDPRGFAATTHDFESRYTEGLIGPLPGFAATYAERSPAQQVSARTCPILQLHGQDDAIVPPAQAHALAAQLTRQGIRHALLRFSGESHGFRRAETIIAALEAELSFYAQTLNFPHPDTPALSLHTTTPDIPEPAPDPEPVPPPAATSTPEPPPAPPSPKRSASTPPVSSEAIGEEQPSRA